MSKREKYRFIFLLLSGGLYSLMLILLPTESGIGELLAKLFASITFGVAIISAAIYYHLLRKTTYVFLSELFTIVGLGLIVLTVATFPYG